MTPNLFLSILLGAAVLGLVHGVPRTVMYNVQSDIRLRFATTQITTKVVNDEGSDQEVTFSHQLPDKAFITNFTMLIGTDLIIGDVEPKDVALRRYAVAKRNQEFAGLISQNLRNSDVFETNVNLKSFSEVTFTFTYQEFLERVDGLYRHVLNLNPGQVVDDFEIKVTLTERKEISRLQVPDIQKKGTIPTSNSGITSDLPNTKILLSADENKQNSASITYKATPNEQRLFDFYGINGRMTVSYDVARDQNTGGEIDVINGYFVHFFAPDGLQPNPKHIVFVLDKSGSMNGDNIRQVKDAMSTILSELQPDDYFNVVVFSNEVKTWKSQSVQATHENTAAARDFVNGVRTGGGTNIHDSLQAGLQMALQRTESNRVPMVLFLTDGIPTVGKEDPFEIIQGIRQVNVENQIILHTLAFGEKADFNFLRKVANEYEGVARKIYVDSDAALQIEGFYREISSSLLRNVKINYLNDTVDKDSLVMNSPPNLYDGAEIVTVGRLRRWDSNVQAYVWGTNNENHRVFRSEGVDARSLADPSPLPASQCYEVCPAGQQFFCRPCPLKMASKCKRCRLGEPNGGAVGPHVPLPTSTLGGMMERLWAYLTIKKLLKDTQTIDKTQLDAMGNAKRDRAMNLSLAYKFVSPLTSMVVTTGKDSVVAQNGDPLADPLVSTSSGGSQGSSGQGNSVGSFEISGFRGAEKGPNNNRTPFVTPKPVIQNAMIKFKEFTSVDKFQEGYNFVTVTVANKQECAQLCFNDHRCNVAKFVTAQSKCAMSSQSQISCHQPQIMWGRGEEVVLYCIIDLNNLSIN